MRQSLLHAATLAAVFIGALAAYLQYAGTSPIAWLDTFRDESEVRQCLINNSCTPTGVATSLRGLVAGVAWLELRTLLARLGMGLNGAHLVMQLLNAFAVLLIFHLATQLGGRLAGTAALCIVLVLRFGSLTVRLTVLYNEQFLLFLGAVFVLACTAVVERPGVVAVALAALVGAVMANVHLACVMTGVSVVWAALLAPRRRFLLAAFGAALFALATIAVAPPSWLHNLTGLIQDREASGSAAGATAVAGNQLLTWALFAIGAWVVSLAGRAPAWVEYRRRSQGALAVIVPILAAFLVAPHFGIDASPRYLAHINAACAIAAGLPLALVAGAMLRRMFHRRLIVAVEQMLPFAVALVIGLPVPLSVLANAPIADDERTPTVADLMAVSHLLHDEHGWDVPRMIQGLKTPSGVAVLAGLPQLGAASNQPSRVVADAGSSALLMMLEADELPYPLPSSWTVVRRSARAAPVLIVMQSRIDWSTFAVCVQAADGPEPLCEESGWRFDEATAGFAVPHMPPAGRGWRGTLTLRLPLRPGSTEEIFMPRLRDSCGGHITSVSGGTSQVGPDRRHATVWAAEPAQAIPATIEFEWQIGAPECEGGMSGAYDGLPPFVVAGDAVNVRLVEAILRKREG